MTGFAPIAATSLGQSSTNANYALSVVSGTFTLSMQGAAKLITDIYPSGNFTYSGHAATLTAQRPANFGTGVFTFTGQNVTFDHGFGVIANNGSFTLTGQNVIFEKGFGIGANSGSFSVTGQSIDFKKDMNVDLSNATFTLTGQDALKGVGEAFDRGQFTYSGQDATLFVGRFLRPVSGQYNYTFQNFKIRGWLSPSLPPAIWTDVA